MIEDIAIGSKASSRVPCGSRRYFNLTLNCFKNVFYCLFYRYLENELGLKRVNWSQNDNKKEIAETSFSNGTAEVSKKESIVLPSLVQKNSQTNQDENKDNVYTTVLKLDNSQFCTKDKTQNNITTSDDHRKQSISKELLFLTNSTRLTNISIRKNDVPELNCTKIHEQSSAHLSILNIINVFGSKILFEKFQEYLQTQNEIGLSIGIRKHQTTKMLIGEHLLHTKRNNQTNSIFNCTFEDDLYVKGISLYLTDSNCYFLNLQNDSTCPHIKFKDKLNFIKRIFDYSNITLHIFHAKEQLKIIKKILPNLEKVSNRLRDPKIADWLIQPEIENCLVKMVNFI